MIDLHNHTLWGVDDGAPTVGHAHTMLAAYAELGYQTVAFTPHLFHPCFPLPDPDVLQTRFAALERIAHPLGVEVHLWGEHYFSAGMVEAFTAGRTGYQLLGGRYLLMEFGAFDNLGLLGNFMFRLQLSGIAPVLAHPERYSLLDKQWAQLLRMRECGCLFQLNARSLAGRDGTRVQRLALKLIREGLADVVASDAHSVEDIRETVPPAAVQVERTFGPETADRLFSRNPGLLVQGQTLGVA